MSEPIYRRLTEEQFKLRGNDPIWVEGGKLYRISELVPQADGSARFQAWEVDAPAPAPTREAEQEVENWPAVPDVLIGPEVAKYVDPPLLEPNEFPPLPPEPPPPEPPPPLKEWARKRGWSGHGPVQKVLKAEYAEKYGV